jgi:hypothetical protein
MMDKRDGRIWQEKGWKKEWKRLREIKSTSTTSR